MARETKPKAANGTGSVVWRNGKLYARITLPDGCPKRVPIPVSYTTPERQREFAASFAEKVRAGKITVGVVHRAASPRLGPVTTVRDVLKAWTKGELLAKYGAVNGL